MALNKKISDNLTKRFIVMNIAMKGGALVISLAAVGVLVMVLARAGDKALAPKDKSIGKEANQPAQPAYTPASRIYSFPSAGAGSNSGPSARSAPRPSQAVAPQSQATEADVRYILAMMGLVGEGSYYRVIDQADPACGEALNRWKIGIRPTNLAEFDLASGSSGAIVVKKGTTEKIDGMSVQLSGPTN